MTRRKLAPEEAALWNKVIATVRPMEKAAPLSAPLPVKAGVGGGSSTEGGSMPPSALPVAAKTESLKRADARAHPQPLPASREGSSKANTLDGSWDRNLSRGQVSPESSVDLHGLTLSAAYDRLDRGLAEAISRGDRVLLLVTGKPPKPQSERPHSRGAIRAAVGDWLAASRHSSSIAAVRAAHPRHGGAGAIYIVLRRAKTIVAKPKS